MTVNEIAKEILTSELSGAELSSLFDTIKRKQKMTRDTEVALKAVSLKPGDRVRLFGLSPKYLNGLVGEVQSVENTRARVKLEDSFNLRRFGTTPKVPLACLEVL